MDLAALTLQSFEPLVGQPFTIDRDTPGAIDLVLESAKALGSRPGGRDPFTLVFRGPLEPALPQHIYRLEHAELGALEVFIVPIARDGDGLSYEAIFT